MSSQKRITPEQLTSVEASYEDMSGMIADSADFLSRNMYEQLSLEMHRAYKITPRESYRTVWGL